MERYLFRISTKKTDAWSRKDPKPVYFVAKTKEEAKEWADKNLADGLSVASVSKLAVQLAAHVYSGHFSK